MGAIDVKAMQRKKNILQFLKMDAIRLFSERQSLEFALTRYLTSLNQPMNGNIVLRVTMTAEMANQKSLEAGYCWKP